MNQSSSFSSWFKGIKGRLLGAAVIPVIGFSVLYVISNRGTDKLNVVIDSAHSEIIPNIVALNELRQARNKFGFMTWNYIMSENNDDRTDALKGMTQGLAEYETNYKKYTESPFSGEEKKNYEAVKDKFAVLINAMKKMVDTANANTPESKAQLKTLLKGDFSSAGDIAGGFTRDTTLGYVSRAQAENKEADVTVASVSNMLIFTTLCASFLIFGLLMWLAATVSKSVSSIAERLSTAGGQVASSVEQLNEAGNSLSQSSTEAAASLEETVAALEEMTSMVQMNSDNAKQAASLSASSRDAAEVGEREIKSLIESMNDISQSSKKIEEIISVIDDIAFQTNLLALNAAVEAARAGEQGKGFAVVAEAVRALAQRSAASAKDISSLIKESVHQIDNGSQIADKSGTVLANIVNSIKKVSDLNNEIAAASSEQTTGIQQISKAMNQLDQASQSNAASAEEIAATSGEINNLAMVNQNLTIELNNVILGSTTVTAEIPVGATAKASTTKPFAKKSNVVSFKQKPAPQGHSAKPSAASEVIPFEDDHRKVGTTDGF
ncbi:methyl-accepting chemotaxis protein [Bdellovibrio sp. NC01]|uniref:HAMP domain-containing methyl-accepting chemotaxis protein n=1 Tax=Bdellovibrio sp. NC01 TaxID=2220073 RepID=UPI00115AD4F2|nr:methyl-accepting chemotaxis protein [Bdellovibrio sp. NC01]QDK37323.1 chemotaxis protein [Bdellovibrio sp. NC01]